MRIGIYYIVLLLSFVLCACNQSPTNETKESSITKTEKPVDAASDWNTLQTQIGLNDEELGKLKKVIGRYNKKQKSLQKEKKWAGPANRPNRASHTKEKEKAVRRAIGAEKGNKYLEIAQKS